MALDTLRRHEQRIEMNDQPIWAPSGTGIVSCFALDNPILPVWWGELQCRGLGLAVEVFDDDGQPIRQRNGELVCVKPFPAMPVGFWNDADGTRYRAAYFETFPNAWRHGDFCEITAHDGLIIYGRSGAVLNPGGVRIGTAEIYRQVEKRPEAIESLVIGQDWNPEVRVVLFVRLRRRADARRCPRRPDQAPDPRQHHIAPRPGQVMPVADIPRTRSGKIVELAVRNVVHGQPVNNIEALANAEALKLFADLPELREG